MPRHFPRRADAFLFWILSAAALALSTLSVAGSLAQVGRTFPGFVVWNNLFVPALGRPHWNGIRAAIPSASVPRPSTENPSPIARTCGSSSDRPAGAVHRYALEVPGHAGATTREVASQRFTATDWAATMGVYVLNGWRSWSPARGVLARTVPEPRCCLRRDQLTLVLARRPAAGAWSGSTSCSRPSRPPRSSTSG
jgi:hypothetical protein